MKATMESGLTLVEVLVALVVMVVVIAALIATQVMSLRMTRSAQESSLATQLAVDTLTDRAVEVTARYEEFQECPGPGCSGDVEKGDYVANWSVSRGIGYEFDGLLLLDVQVSGPATAHMATYLSCMDYDAAGATPTLLNPGVCAPESP